MRLITLHTIDGMQVAIHPNALVQLTKVAEGTVVELCNNIWFTIPTPYDELVERWNVQLKEG